MAKQFSSNTLGGSGNQYYFVSDGSRIRSRVLYRIKSGGRYNYRLTYSNVIASTFADGSKSVANRILPEWTVHSIRVARGDRDCVGEGGDTLDESMLDRFCGVTIGGRSSYEVHSGELFTTDEFEFFAETDEYLCVELEFSGSELPMHEESLLPIFVYNDGWHYCKETPLPSLVACDRQVSKSIAFIGDSITQGIGTKNNSYAHWNAMLAKRLGDKLSYWNLGLGYGRASDVASRGIWFELAASCDVIFICFGVNDLLQVGDEDAIKADLESIVKSYKAMGRTVVIQTLPPFDYVGSLIEKWVEINRFIKQELAKEADFVFDCVPILGKEDAFHLAKYGTHPNEEGCSIWADALFKALPYGLFD